MNVLGVFLSALLASRLGFLVILGSFLPLGGYSLHVVFSAFLGLGWPMLCCLGGSGVLSQGVGFVFCLCFVCLNLLSSCYSEIHYDL